VKRVALFFAVLLVAGAIAGLAGVLVPALASNKSSPPTGVSDAPHANPQLVGPQVYDAKFVCGTVSESDFLAGAPVVPGTYETTINVHNPSSTDPVPMVKWASVALPGEELGPLVVLGFGYEVLPNHAFEIDCEEISNALALPAGTFVKGFVGIIISDGALDVTAVYSAQYLSVAAGSEGLGQAMDVEPVPARAYVSDPTPGGPSNVYAAKFVCGAAGADDPVVAADYRSAINVYNPNGFDVYLQKKVVLANPEGEEFGDISEWRNEIIPPNGAFEIDCADIESFFPDPDPPLPPLIKGFVVIETLDEPTGLAFNGELDVVPVHTVRRVTGTPNNGYGMDIEVLRVAKQQKTALPAP
jgi:hypothetical protein